MNPVRQSDVLEEIGKARGKTVAQDELYSLKICVIISVVQLVT
jgi:hypothetical protein